MGTAIVALLVAVLPCNPSQPEPAADPSVAGVYLEIARSEDAAGQVESAAAAYHRVLAHDPDNAEARRRLRVLCAEADLEAALEEALVLFQERKYEAAAERLERLLADARSADAALLAGMARYEAGDDAQALRWLELAEDSPPVSDAAAVFKGLVLLRMDRPADAAVALDPARDAADVRLRSAAIDLSRAADEARRGVLTAAVDAVWDSNVSLSPEAAAAQHGPSDAAVGVSATGTGRPFGGRAPFVRVQGLYRKYLSLTEFDTAVGSVGVGWRFGGRGGAISLEYGFDATALDSALWSTAHRATVHGTWSFAGVQGLSGFASLNGRSDAYWRSEFARFSGPRLDGVFGLELRVGLFQAGAAARMVRSFAQDTSFAFAQPGAAVSLAARPHPRLRMQLQVGWASRTADARDSDFGLVRQDVILHGELAVDWEVARAIALSAGLGGHQARSNVAQLSWSRLSATVGVRGAAALF